MGIIPHIIYYTTNHTKKATVFHDFFTGFSIFGSLSVSVGKHLATLRIFVDFLQKNDFFEEFVTAKSIFFAKNTHERVVSRVFGKNISDFFD